MSRTTIPKKLRFEVFKRDSFTCQYCGEKAPDVILHVDHIRPVADGGGNDVLNLVTSCATCNSGKGAVKLDDRSVVERQRAQLKELQERREQLEAMLRWRDGLETEKTDIVTLVVDRVEERGGGFVPNENGVLRIRQWLKRFPLDEVLQALDDSFDFYMKFEGGEPVAAAWDKAFGKIPAIASMNRQAKEKPYIPKLCWVQGILRKRFSDPKGQYVRALEEMHVDTGIPVSALEHISKVAADWDDFCAKALMELRRGAHQ